MNTEINLLEKEPSKYSAYLWFSIVFILLLLIVSSLLFYQRNLISSDIETLADRQAEIELELMKIQKEFLGKRELQQLQQEVEMLKDEMFPTVSLYQDILGLLDTVPITSYDFAGGQELVIQASFSTLDDIADYVTSLLEQEYVTATALTSVSQVESSYQATLTITINRDNLIEEIDTDD